MKLTPVHHIPMRPEFKSPFSAGYLVEGGRLFFFSGCGPLPIYHRHPHDPVDEAQWYAGGFRAQCERTFENIRLALKAVGGDWPNMLKLNIYLTDMSQQNILNEISARTFDPRNPPARTLIAVPELAHPDMLLEIEGVAAVPRAGPASRKKAATKVAIKAARRRRVRTSSDFRRGKALPLNAPRALTATSRRRPLRATQARRAIA